MIVRIVHMHFNQEDVPTFLALFERFREDIASQPGCRKLHLTQHSDHPHQYSTLSIWDDQAALDAYRHSALFGAVWPSTKALFSAPPEAESHALIWAS